MPFEKINVKEILANELKNEDFKSVYERICREHDCSFDYEFYSSDELHANYEHCHNCDCELNVLRPVPEGTCVFCEDCIKLLNEK